METVYENGNIGFQSVGHEISTGDVMDAVKKHEECSSNVVPSQMNDSTLKPRTLSNDTGDNKYFGNSLDGGEEGIKSIFIRQEIVKGKEGRPKKGVTEKKIEPGEKSLQDILRLVSQMKVSPPTTDNHSAEEEYLAINFGYRHAALILYLSGWNVHVEMTNKVLQCVLPYDEVFKFLTSFCDVLVCDGNINRTSVKLLPVEIDGIRNFMDFHEAIEPICDFVKPALVTAAELGEYGLCSWLIQKDIPCDIFLLWYFSRKILAHLCLSRSTLIITQYLDSINFPIDFTDAFLLAYEKQNVEAFEFILSLNIVHLDIKVKDFSLAISSAVEVMDVSFLKYLHEKGVDAAKLTHTVQSNQIVSFLQACFALKFTVRKGFPFKRDSVLTSFIPACLEALIRHSRSPLTCINAVMKTNPSELSSLKPVPNLKYLLTVIMKDTVSDATVVKVLMQLWHATQGAASRVEEEQEDLKHFQRKLEQVVLEVFTCDNTNLDVNLIPLVKMQHAKDCHSSATNGVEDAKNEYESTTKDLHWIFGLHSLIRHAIDRKFKVLFAASQINRLIVQIFQSAKMDFKRTFFKERFYPMILFYVQMCCRFFGFILLAKIVILDYGRASRNAFSFSGQYASSVYLTPFSNLEIFLAIFILSEIFEEFGQLYEIKTNLEHRNKVHSLHLLDEEKSKALFQDVSDDSSSDDDHSFGDDNPTIPPQLHRPLPGDQHHTVAPKTLANRSRYDSFYRQMSKSSQTSFADEKIKNRLSVSRHRQPSNSIQRTPGSRPLSQSLHTNIDQYNLLRRHMTRRVSGSVSGTGDAADGEFSAFPLIETPTDSAEIKADMQKHKLLKRRKRNLEIVREYFRDEWNFLDVANAMIGLIWFVLRCIPSQAVPARITLSLLAIPWSLRLLRFLSINKTLGELVIIIRAMLSDVVAFLLVYLLMIVGFSVAFRGLFSDTVFFNSNGETFLNLFAGTMSNFSFDLFVTENATVNVIGVILTVVFVVMTAVLLMNLLIARMSNSFQRISDNSQMEWAFERARMVMSLTLIREKPVWNILPAPLNLIPIFFNAFGILDWLVRQHAQSSEGVETYVSVRGTVANITLFVVCFPFMKSLEVYLAFANTFLLRNEDPMLPRTFFWILLQIVFELVTFLPMFLGILLYSCCMGTFKNAVWISRMNVSDSSLVLGQTEPKVDEESGNGELSLKSLSGSNKVDMSSKSFAHHSSIMATSPHHLGLSAKHNNTFSFTSPTSSMADIMSHSTSNHHVSSRKPHLTSLASSSSSLYRSMSFLSTSGKPPAATGDQARTIFGEKDIELILKPLSLDTNPLPKDENMVQFQRLHAELESVRKENKDIKDMLHIIVTQLRSPAASQPLSSSQQPAIDNELLLLGSASSSFSYRRENSSANFSSSMYDHSPKEVFEKYAPVSSSSLTAEQETRIQQSMKRVSDPSDDDSRVNVTTFGSTEVATTTDAMKLEHRPLPTILTGIPVLESNDVYEDSPYVHNSSHDNHGANRSLQHHYNGSQTTRSSVLQTPASATSAAVSTSGSSSSVWWNALNLIPSFSSAADS